MSMKGHPVLYRQPGHISLLHRNVPQNCRVDKVLPPHITLQGHWAMFWCQHPLKDVGRAAGWRRGLWKLFQRWRKYLTAGNLNVICLADKKIDWEMSWLELWKYLWEKYVTKELLSSEEKQKKNWGLEAKAVNASEKWRRNLLWGGR